MFRQLKKAAGLAAAILATTTMISTAQADAYPEKAITLVVPYGAGGASDLAGRALAETARSYTDGQPVVVVNKTGNGGMNGARFVTEQKPDGYTLLLSRVGMALYPAVYADSPVAGTTTPSLAFWNQPRWFSRSMPIPTSRPLMI